MSTLQGIMVLNQLISQTVLGGIDNSLAHMKWKIAFKWALSLSSTLLDLNRHLCLWNKLFLGYKFVSISEYISSLIPFLFQISKFLKKSRISISKTRSVTGIYWKCQVSFIWRFQAVMKEQNREGICTDLDHAK